MPERAYLREWLEAKQRERQARDFAFLDLPQDICGEPIRAMRLRDFSLLIAVGSPFLCGGPVTSEACAQILWILSPQYDANNLAARSAFLSRIADKDPEAVETALRHYVAATLMDAPGGSDETPVCSFEASVINLLAREHGGWSKEYIMDQPMVQIFQYIRIIRRKNGETVVDSGSLSAPAHVAYLNAINAVPPEERAAWRERQEQLCREDA